MGKKKNLPAPANISDVQVVQADYVELLDTDPEYSLEVDPLNKYNMSDEQKTFIKAYSQFKSIPMARELAGIEAETAKMYFIDYNSQEEIRRINRAMYHRQFASKMITLDQIGGYLTSMLTDENVPYGDRLKSTDKLRVAAMLVDLIKLKQEGTSDPSKVMKLNLDAQIKNLSITTIQQLIQSSTNSEDVVVSDDSMSAEEKEYLGTLSTDQLLELIEESNKGGDKHDE